MKTRSIEGFKMCLDPNDGGISGVLMSKGSREPCFMWILRRETGGEIGIDIGGNIGYTTLPMCATMDRVIAFEPDARSRKLLEASISLNEFNEKTEIRDEAVSDRTGEISMFMDARPNLSTIVGSGKKGSTTTVKTITLDSMGVEPSFIKMDIEGGEVGALNGGMECLQATPKCKILIEVHPQYYNEGNNFRDVVEKLLGIGYGFKYVVSAAVPRPDLFVEHGYNPLEGAPIGRRAIYTDVAEKHALDWCSRSIEQIQPNGKTSPKIVRAIMLEKPYIRYIINRRTVT